MVEILIQLLSLIFIDVLFIGMLALLLIPLMVFKKASAAIVKRNVIGYFSNPTGYVFLCVFVLLSSIAAFWTDDFFVANLANLDQLSRYMPLILLLFIPAITMNIWSEERRQGTDELLLTLPATDFDIVLGKYISAAAIFTLSLLFAQFASYSALTVLSEGDLDVGLIFTTYIGYWMMGLAMLSLGMVASFLSNNGTISFVLGMTFNGLLVAIAYIDRIITSPTLASQVMQWSLDSRFSDFGRGVVSLSSILFFLSIIILGIYISIVLIGRRHWSGRGRDETQSELTTLIIGVSLGVLVLGLVCLFASVGGRAAASSILQTRLAIALEWSGLALIVLSLLAMQASAILNAMQGGMLGHYILRTECLIVAALGFCFFVSRHDFFRRDFTQNDVNSLSPDTRQLIADLDPKRPVTIDAFISAEVPKEFIRTKYNLISSLQELSHVSGGKIKVRIHDNLELFSEEASRAETRFGIKRQTVQSQDKEKVSQAEMILGAAFTCGLEKVVVPFFGHGLPVEYELVRSITTVSQTERKKLGIVTTDAQMYGGFSMVGMSPRNIPKQALIDELEKQYRVEQVDPATPIELGKYDALLIVQPSSLGPQQLSHVVDAVRAGQPCAIFEDPMPYIFGQGSLVGTAQEKPPQGGFMGMGGGPPPPKGDIRALWDALGIKVLADSGPPARVPDRVVWQRYNPYPKFARGLGPELVFVREDAPGARNVFNREAPMVAGMEELLLLFPGGMERSLGSKLETTELVATATEGTGTVGADKLRELQGDMAAREKEFSKNETNVRYVLASEIRAPNAILRIPKSSLGDLEGKYFQLKDSLADKTYDFEFDPKGNGVEKDRIAITGSTVPAITQAMVKAINGTKAKHKITAVLDDEDVKIYGNKIRFMPQKDQPVEDTLATNAPRDIHCVYVCDVDCLEGFFLQNRNMPNPALPFRFDNVVFALNAIDQAAGDDRFLRMRIRKPRHSTLRMIERQVAETRKNELEQLKKYQARFDEGLADIQEKKKKAVADFEKKRDELQKKQDEGQLDPAQVLEFQEFQRLITAIMEVENQKEKTLKEKLEKELQSEAELVRRKGDRLNELSQNAIKIAATVIPLIFPLLIGLVVFAVRRVREREGVSKNRLRY